MKRRDLLAGAAMAAVTSRAWAQPVLPRIAYLSGRSFGTDLHLLQAFREGLKTTGYTDLQNVTVDVQWADGRYSEAPKLAAEVVASGPKVIAAVGGNPVSLAVKAATSAIPVVFGSGGDPVALGLVSNLARPEGNLTGITLWTPELEAKRLDLLREMLPRARTVALLLNPTNPGAGESDLQRTQAVAASLGLTLELLQASSSSEIERAFEQLTPGKVDALVVAADAFLINRRRRITGLAALRRLPAIFPAREFTEEGGLASYGTRWADMYGIIGSYAGRLLKGAKPADLPVQSPTRYELVVNLATAKMLGLTLPAVFLARANEVLE